MSKLSVCIDAGHGGRDPGATNGSRHEADDVLKFAKRLRKVLEANGVICYMTRTDDTYSAPHIKAHVGNETKADYFVSIHRNAGVPSANGVEIELYSLSGTKYKIAKDILKRWERFGFKNRGCKTRKDLTVLARTDMPAMLLEVGFITNESDNKIFDENMAALVNDVARGIMGQFGLKFQTLTQLGKA